MNIQVEYINYTHQGTALEGYLAWDSDITVKRPAVMIAHPWAGRIPFTEDKARKIAALGYIGFAIDMYGKGIIGTDKESCNKLMTQQLEDRKALQSRMLTALDALKKHPQVNADKIAGIGYCFGGLCMLDLARTGVDMAGIATFHALLNAPSYATKQINTPLLIMHGHADPMVSSSEINELHHELTTTNADWQFHHFGGVMHAFTNPDANDVDFGTVYHEPSDRRSWQMLVNFLDEVF